MTLSPIWQRFSESSTKQQKSKELPGTIWTNNKKDFKVTDAKYLLAEQNATRIARDAIAKATGPSTSNVVSRSVCLVTNFGQRPDLPVGTALIKMATVVVETLANMGLHEPVSLKLLPDSWWVAHADASTDNPNFEAGGGTIEVIADTEMLTYHYSTAYCEVTHGPYGSRDEVDGCCFASEKFDRRRLGKNANVILIPSWSAKALADQGVFEPIPASTLWGKWWVCGMGGGVVQTENLVIQRSIGHHITDGPFDTKEDADYAFDVLWESPE
jgi:hypothetical protein